MSYRNPKQIQDDGLRVLSGQIARQQQKDDSRAQRNQQMLAANISSVSQGIMKSVADRKKGMKDLDNELVRGEATLLAEVAGKDRQIGKNNYDSGVEKLMYGKIEQYNYIMRNLSNMEDPQKGKRDLAKIQSEVNDYAAVVPKMMAYVQVMEDQAKEGAKRKFSTIEGAPTAKELEVLRKISVNGEVNVYSNDSGDMIVQDKQGNKLNLTALNKVEMGEWIKYQADTKEGTNKAFSEVINTKDGEGYNPTYVTYDKANKDAQPTMNETQYNAYLKATTGIDFVDGKNNITTNTKGFYTDYPSHGSGGGDVNSFSTMLNEAGESIWEDSGNMNEGTQWPNPIPEKGTKEFTDFINSQYIPALEYLANESLDGEKGAGIKKLYKEVNNNSNLANKKPKGESSADAVDIVEVDATGESVAVGVEGVNNVFGVTNANTQGDNQFEFIGPNSTYAVPVKDAKSTLLKTNKGDGKDGYRRIGNFEAMAGNSEGKGLPQYGMGAEYLDKLKKAKKDPNTEEGLLYALEEIALPEALAEIGISKDEFNKALEKPDKNGKVRKDVDLIKGSLVDWKYNTGRDVNQLLHVAQMMKDKEVIDGKETGKFNWEDKVDLGGLSLTKLMNMKGDEPINVTINDKTYKNPLDALEALTAEDSPIEVDLGILSPQEIANAKHAIMGDEDSRSKEKLTAYQKTHKYRINQFI
tara:strand:- start:8898 stop:10982 length:2085 start_codon:yes stop_codon:yes gene_type:complete